jgi:SAM-dependent methyltransferase
MADVRDDQTTGAGSSSAPGAAPARARRRWWLLLVVFAVLVASGSAFAWWKFNHTVFDPTPLPRAWINAPFVTTPPEVVDAMLELAEVKETDLVYDLGCGDGRIVVAAAEKFGCRGVGYDIEPERIRESRERAKTHNVEDLVSFEQKDVFTLDLAQADVITIYLLPRYMKKLIPQLQALKPGSRIVAHDFPLEDIPPDKKVRLQPAGEDNEHTVYLWVAPIKVPPAEAPAS